MKKTITTGLLMILMIIMNINLKAQTLNNVFTDKNSFGPVRSGNAGVNYVIINDSLYITGSSSFIKAIGVENMSFQKVVFMYSDFSRNNLYIATKDSGFYMYNTSDGITRRLKPFINISSYTVKIDAANSANDRIFVSSNDRILSFDLNSTTSNTVSIAAVNAMLTTGIISLEYDNINFNLLYSTGSIVYRENDVLNTSLGSNTYTYTVNDMEFFNGSLYYATNHGVYNSTNPTTDITNTDTVYNVINTYNNNLYFAKANGKIFNCNTSNIVTPMSYNNTTNFVSKVNSISYVQTSDGTTVQNYYLWVSTDKGLFIDIADSIAADTAVFPVNRMMFNNLPNSYLAATGTNTTTGINESVLENTSGLYPVPNNGSFSYKTQYAGTLQIINISDQIVFEQKIEEGTTKIEMKLSPGIYIAQFSCVQGTVRKKFVVD